MMAGRNFARRPCPVCNGVRRKRLFRQSFEPMPGARLVEGYDVVVCKECGAGFADDIPPQVVFDEYYRGHQSNPAPLFEQRLRDIAALIAEFIPSQDARVVEVQCGSGSLREALSARGYWNLSVISDVGLEPGGTCDFLVLTDVLEHIADLEQAVAQFRRLLRPGGLLYAEVPDASRYESRVDAPFQEFSVEHINFFSGTSLGNLFQARGFRPVHAGLTVRPLHEAFCPCTYRVFESTGDPAAIEFDRDTEPGLRHYIASCRTEDTRIRGLIRESLPGEGRFIVWGTGTHTLRLLANGGLDPARIAAFVDSNPRYQDRDLRGIPVYSPRDVRSRTEPILISSRSCQHEIQQQIRNGMGMENPVILLYESYV